MQTLTLKTLDNSNAVTINAPQYGYTSELHMAIHTNDMRSTNGTISFFDCGSTYDYRVCSISTWMLPTVQKIALNTFLRDPNIGRTANLQLLLGTSPTGFFPFGADKGDSGTFTIRITNRTQGGMLLSPYTYWVDKLTLVLIDAPAYSYESGKDQGKFSVADVDGLLFPQAGFKPESSYAVKNSITRNGTPYAVDGSQSSDYWTSKFSQQLNTGKAAELLAALASQRAECSTLIAGNNYYPFGGDNCESGVFAVNSLGSDTGNGEIVVKAKHEGFNRWSIPLVFLYVGSIAGYTFRWPLITSGTGHNTYTAPLNVTKQSGMFDSFNAPLKQTEAGGYIIVDLDYDSSTLAINTEGLQFADAFLGKLPAFTTAARLALPPTAGQLVFDTTASAAYLYNGTAWEKL